MLPICLEEIQRCRHYFIVLLGERYGWVPINMPQELIDREPWLAEHQERSVNEPEILHSVLNNPQMADHALFYLRDPAYIESLLWKKRGLFEETAIQEKIERLGLDEAQWHCLT